MSRSQPAPASEEGAHRSKDASSSSLGASGAALAVVAAAMAMMEAFIMVLLPLWLLCVCTASTSSLGRESTSWQNCPGARGLAPF